MFPFSKEYIIPFNISESRPLFWQMKYSTDFGHPTFKFESKKVCNIGSFVFEKDNVYMYICTMHFIVKMF